MKKNISEIKLEKLEKILKLIKKFKIKPEEIFSTKQISSEEYNGNDIAICDQNVNIQIKLKETLVEFWKSFKPIKCPHCDSSSIRLKKQGFLKIFQLPLSKKEKKKMIEKGLNPERDALIEDLEVEEEEEKNHSKNEEEKNSEKKKSKNKKNKKKVSEPTESSDDESDLSENEIAEDFKIRQQL